MKANELRIGNYVSDVHSTTGMWKIVTLGEIRVKYGNFKPNIYTAKYDHLRPIPLTPEILEKCGFDNHRGNEHIISLTLDKHLSLTMMPDGFYPILLADPEFSSGELQVISINKIEFLHQLQNLYFALTGEELEVKL